MLGESPRMAAERRAREKQAEIEAIIRNDDNVVQMVELFAARLLPGSIKPVDPSQEKK